MSDPIGGQYSLNLLQVSSTINSTKNVRILFSRITFKDIFAMFKFASPISLNSRVILSFRKGLTFIKLSGFEVS